MAKTRAPPCGPGVLVPSQVWVPILGCNLGAHACSLALSVLSWLDSGAACQARLLHVRTGLIDLEDLLEALPGQEGSGRGQAESISGQGSVAANSDGRAVCEAGVRSTKGAVVLGQVVGWQSQVCGT